MNSPTRHIYLESGYGEGIVFHSDDTAVVAAALSRATVVTGYNWDKEFPITDKSPTIQLIWKAQMKEPQPLPVVAPEPLDLTADMEALELNAKAAGGTL